MVRSRATRGVSNHHAARLEPYAVTKTRSKPAGNGPFSSHKRRIRHRHHGFSRIGGLHGLARKARRSPGIIEDIKGVTGCPLFAGYFGLNNDARIDATVFRSIQSM